MNDIAYTQQDGKRCHEGRRFGEKQVLRGRFVSVSREEQEGWSSEMLIKSNLLWSELQESSQQDGEGCHEGRRVGEKQLLKGRFVQISGGGLVILNVDQKCLIMGRASRQAQQDGEEYKQERRMSEKQILLKGRFCLLAQQGWSLEINVDNK